MRRMREFTFAHFAVIAVPVLAAAFGIHHWVKHRHPKVANKIALDSAHELAADSKHGKQAVDEIESSDLMEDSEDLYTEHNRAPAHDSHDDKTAEPEAEPQ